ncbi:MAG: orotate phosphoribosyltransferase [Candidatus Abyssobacteria bacterium SURF_17]|jgi:orotate phosphoribosyltransferase|uniref:Orotate phosphoribosyltransferase n=1 Tax=Candidatus Abyssobacteria bacterium SURF_17 TaxID=2093361 RepID=A0A419F9W2_9BACT|nr:MAG: orotate phosphoribosyltransferase [Candidatus Abyssubacteria bacterium SURF_17]
MPSRKPAPEKLSPKEVLELFEQKGALLSGHFLLTSGLHSERYLQCAIVLQYPQLAERLGSALAQRFSGVKIDCVVGPAIGGIVIAHEVARALGVRAMFMERESGSMTLRRGFMVTEGDRILVVEDVTTTGGSVKEVISTLGNAGASVVGVGALIDRSGGKVEFGVPFKPLARVQVTTFSKEACPLCRRGISLYKPGSRKA